MGAAFATLAAAQSAVNLIDGMGSLTRALEVETPLLLLLTSSSCAAAGASADLFAKSTKT